MGELESRWSRRHKRRGRRVAYDLRLVAPLIAIALCLAGSSTAILAVERVSPVAPGTPAFEVGAPMAALDCSPVE
jgi:hypothetical protein